MKRPITFMEGFRSMRKLQCGWFVCAFMATVWVLRGDLVNDPKNN